MIINEKKAKEIVINFLKSEIDIPELEINGEKIEQVQNSKLLGVTISYDLTWGKHVKKIRTKATQRLYFLRLLKRTHVSMDKMLQIYCSLVRPTTEYACQVWHGTLTGELSDAIESVEERALEIIMRFFLSLEPLPPVYKHLTFCVSCLINRDM